MRTVSPSRIAAGVLAVLALIAPPLPAHATDVDGPDDCPKPIVDWGDAPEDVLAYPGVKGRFPTCLAAGPIGTQELACVPPLSTAPGPAGHVRHQRVAGQLPYWLGCGPQQGGIDDDAQAKVNDTGGPTSACAATQSIDCVEAAFGMSFGQDECYGSNDAGIAAAVQFGTCVTTQVRFDAYSCATAARDVYLNILVDWNQDGDWNDNFQCAGGCAYEWAVKNVPIVIGPGCQTLSSPLLLTGPNAGYGWMRITLCDTPVSDDFPWAGSASGGADDALPDGETEDYPVVIGTPTSCPDYEDWGDAPEEDVAYSNGVIGHFPTCSAAGAPGTQEAVCAPISTPPGPTGAVLHVSGPNEPKFWFGCGDPAAGSSGIDAESDGKTNSTGLGPSHCATAVSVDCAEPAFTLTFGQDECIGDLDFDSGLRTPVGFDACSTATVDFWTFDCDPQEPVAAYLNILVDMNQDGDWNDNFQCTPGGPCAYEWAIKNQPILLQPGCHLQSVQFPVGPDPGEGWMRMTLTLTPVGDDFPWVGSWTAAGPGTFRGGETEDHPVRIRGRDSCLFAYEDFGDAPEDLPAYATGLLGHFPTCLAPGTPGTQEAECGVSLSPAPGPTGYVRHVTLATDADHFWLGCGGPGSPQLAVDGEADGKVAVGAPLGGPSACDPAVATDCLENLIGLAMNQDECTGDVDAGIGAPVFFYACSTGTVRLEAYNCTDHTVTAYLNVLVDWNHDGDWNDALRLLCTLGPCAHEWSVKNVAVTLNPGCNTIVTPSFPTGPTPERAWMRVTLSSDPAPDDFPWNGSAAMPGGALRGGETEDHAVNVLPRVGGADDEARPHALWLGAPRPNPARDATGLTYGLPRAAEVSLAVYDLAGRRLVEVERGPRGAGVHTAWWDFRDARGGVVAPGTYIVKLRVGDEVLSRRVVRLR